jgi:hypothetical protein
MPGPAGQYLLGLAAMAMIEAVLALLIAWLFPPPSVDHGLGTALRATLARRPALDWLWRIGLAGALHLPSYFVCGSVAYQFVRGYYEDPTSGVGLAVPGAAVLVPLEIGRGLLFVAAVFPLVALLPGPRWRLALWLGLVIATLGGWVPLLAATFLPPAMRLVHGLEITATAAVQGLTIAWLVGLGQHARVKAATPPASEQPAGHPAAVSGPARQLQRRH